LTGVRFVLLMGDPAVIRARIDARHGHFAGSDLLPSQLVTLQPPPGAVTVDVRGTPDEVLTRALDALRAPTERRPK
jgi:gluconokinase